jgi:hypothetical protein
MSSTGGRSILATIIGWLIVIILIWVFFGWIFATIRFLLRAFLFLVVVGALIALYFRLRQD